VTLLFNGNLNFNKEHSTLKGSISNDRIEDISNQTEGLLWGLEMEMSCE
jgi:hypothetical protein